MKISMTLTHRINLYKKNFKATVFSGARHTTFTLRKIYQKRKLTTALTLE